MRVLITGTSSGIGKGIAQSIASGTAGLHDPRSSVCADADAAEQ